MQLAIDLGADTIAVETNFGGDMAVSPPKGAAAEFDWKVKIKKVSASRGKRLCAEPVTMLHGDPDDPETWDKGHAPRRRVRGARGPDEVLAIGRGSGSRSHGRPFVRRDGSIRSTSRDSLWSTSEDSAALPFDPTTIRERFHRDNAAFRPSWHGCQRAVARPGLSPP